jgi:hypothetical protein
LKKIQLPVNRQVTSSPENCIFYKKIKFHASLTSGVFDLDGLEASDLAAELWSFIFVDFLVSLSAVLSFDGFSFAAVNDLAFAELSFFLSDSGAVGWDKKNCSHG